MKTPNDYSKMQKELYSDPRVSAEAVVGNYDWHENFPYETNLLYRHADVRLPIFGGAKPARALDIGCGPGRMVSRMQPYFQQVDGVDISAPLIKIAREKHPNGEFFETSGSDLGAAPTASYDFVYSTIALQHIAVNSIRKKIFNDVRRVLKPGGKFTLQLAYLDTLPYIIHREESPLNFFGLARREKITQHADWTEDRVNAASSNGLCDVALGPKTLPIALSEFEALFAGVEYWFYDIRVCLKNLRGSAHSDYWASHWVFFHGTRTAEARFPLSSEPASAALGSLWGV